MSTTIKYINEFEKEITAQQKSRLDKYTEQTFIDGILKKKRFFWDQKLFSYTVFIYPEEDLNQELSMLTEVNYDYAIAKDLQIVNGYTSWSFYSYKDGVLSDKIMESVTDSQGREIAWASYGRGGEYSNIGTKTYYLDGKATYDEDGEVDIAYGETAIFVFKFGNDQLIDMDYVLDGDDPYTSIELFVARYQEFLPFMTEEVLQYFTNFEPLIPNIEL